MSGTVRERSTLVIVDDDVALARAVADRFAEEAARAIGARGRFTVALAGGSTPKAAYALLAQSPYREAVPWNGVRFFFSDERCVGPDDPHGRPHRGRVPEHPRERHVRPGRPAGR